WLDVPHEDAAEERAGIVRDDKLLVEAAGGVGVYDLERARLLGARVAETRDIHPRQLELRGVVDRRELGGAAQEAVGDDLRHRIRRGHEPDAATLEAGDLADGPDGGIRGPAVAPDDDSTALAEVESGSASELIARADADREDDEVGRNAAVVRELDGCHGSRVIHMHRRRQFRQVQLDAL